MFELYQKILFDVSESQERLIDVIGYYEIFEHKFSYMLLAISIVFDEKVIHIVAQEDDSFHLYSKNEWQPKNEIKTASLTINKPWLIAINKPLLWAWMLCNQQGYFDGLQMEFAKDVFDESVLIQLVAVGSEIKFRDISNKCNAIKIN